MNLHIHGRHVHPTHPHARATHNHGRAMRRKESAVSLSESVTCRLSGTYDDRPAASGGGTGARSASETDPNPGARSTQPSIGPLRSPLTSHAAAPQDRDLEAAPPTETS